MSTALLNLIIVILITAVILTLIFIVVRLNMQIYKDKKSFKNKINSLQDVILEMSKKQLNQQQQIELSDDLQKTLQSSRIILNEDIFDLNYELFGILSKNKLI